jgi:hypothetical protein
VEKSVEKSMAVVQTENECLDLQRQRKDINNEHIWTLEEFEIVCKSHFVQEIIKLKALVPTAQDDKCSSPKRDPLVQVLALMTWKMI